LRNLKLTIKVIRDLHRGTKHSKKAHQPRTNIAKDESCYLVTGIHSFSARWRNHFSQISNVRGFSKVRQTEIHTAEPLVPEPSAFDFEMAIEKLKRHKSPGIDHIPADLIKTGGRTNRSEIH
jgi:hypothetical protein